MWEIILHRIFGVDGEALERVRAGAGVVRNTTYVIVALWAAAVPILYALSSVPLIAISAVAIFAVVTIIYLIGTWRFAERNPDQAAMGGSEWRRFRQTQLASKNQPEIPDLPSMPDPLKPLPPHHTTLLGAPDDDE
jgi:hypothetical protein